MRDKESWSQKKTKNKKVKITNVEKWKMGEEIGKKTLQIIHKGREIRKKEKRGGNEREKNEKRKNKLQKREKEEMRGRKV